VKEAMKNPNAPPSQRHARMALATASLTLAMFAVAAQALDARKEAKIDIVAGGTVNIVTGGGSVTLRSGSGRQLLVAYTVHSDKVEVDQSSTASNQRVELRTHALAGHNPTAEEAKVDYEITVPAGVSVNVSATSAPVTVDNLGGDIGITSESGQITVRNVVNKSYVHVHSMTAPVTFTDVAGSHVDIHSTAGAVQLKNVTGQHVSVGTTSGNIDYKGDCSGGGDYIITTHSGTINVTLPPTASVDLTARSATGSVENDFPLQEKSHYSFVPKQGRSFAGTSNSGSSSVELQSFSGKIRVKQQ